MWARRGNPVPEAWSRLAVFYFSNPSEVRGPDEPVWAPRDSHELDYELEVAALIDTPAVDLPVERAEEAIGGLHDLQRLVGPGPPARRDDGPSRAGQGQGLRELVRAVAGDAGRAGRRAPGRGYDLAMVARVNGVETSRGRWSDAVHGLADLAARASADARLRPGDVLGSGTVGGGCLLEVRETSSGATWSRATWSSWRSSGWACCAPRSSLGRAPETSKPALPSEPASMRMRVRCDRGRRYGRRPPERGMDG